MLSNEAKAVQQQLLSLGLETPLTDHNMDSEEKYERIKGLMTEVLGTLGLDLTDDSLTETPHRIAKMYVYEVFSGLDYTNFPKISMIENKLGVEEMIKVKDISLVSSCE